ncbi:cytochrome c (plasmid) [Mesorhizobium sp. NBSH29]|uniref:c-type cytochrome n=1 Tax=Mesorhizobium sp. NBSH29 TaxID=2654249 RepID=UPI001896664B|nr:cytochrome c [Mesorhizobium sp. NBSH29]QPC88986.1 cytochrome c [Mesorhizobium sp. NBSH29]
MRRLIALAAILSLSSADGLAAVHIPANGIVAARQAAMKEMARAAKTIAGMFQGKLSYDAAAFKDAAETIRRHSGEVLVKEFLPGSFGGLSDATAEIDRSRAEFAALAGHLETFASALSSAADAAPDGITKSMRMGQGMITGGSLLGKARAGKAEADPSRMPAEHVFHLMLQDCASCHAKFREKAQ